MNIRIGKIIGWIIIIFLGIPSLFTAIWATGITKGMLSRQLISVIPQQILTNLPDLAQTALNEAQKPGAIKDQNTSTWMMAAGRANKNLNTVLNESGISQWLENDLGKALGQIEPMLKGEEEMKNIEVNMEPLKTALTTPIVEDYLKQVVNSLPTCTSQQLTEWRDELAASNEEKQIPACNPGARMVNQIWEGYRTQVNNIPSIGQINDGVSTTTPVRFNLIGWINNWIWVLFLLPLLTIGAGVWLSENNRAKRLSSGGWIMAATALGTLVSGLICQNAIKAAVAAGNFGWQQGTSSPWSWEFYSALTKQIGGIATPLVDQVFSPVINLAIIFLVLGIGMAVAGRDMWQVQVLSKK
ncbi:MAG: hypothetical protein WCT01_05065 [Candidatus Shapirobacteria bacterium]